MILRRCKMKWVTILYFSFNVGACCCIYHAFFDIDSNLGGVFSCLSILLKLNHKIVEPHLTGIWLLIFTLCQGSEKVRATLFCKELVFHVVLFCLPSSPWRWKLLALLMTALVYTQSSGRYDHVYSVLRLLSSLFSCHFPSCSFHCWLQCNWRV